MNSSTGAVSKALKDLAAVKSRTRSRFLLLTYSTMVLFVSYFTYFRSYWRPDGLFWDENYYLTSIYKYLHHIWFMQEHPPLGKLIMALGEKIFHVNSGLDLSYFLTTDHIANVPATFSFVGVRFFPVLLATLSAVLFFLLLYRIFRHRNLALAGSSLYLFENALIVQSRGAMLDSLQIFFALTAILCFLIALDSQPVRLRHYLVLGLLVGATMAVKLTGAVLLILFGLLFLKIEKWRDVKEFFWKLLKNGLVFGAAAMFIFAGSYYVQVLVSQNVLANNYYKASSRLKQVVDKRSLANPLNLPLVVRDSLHYTKQYEASVPHYKANDPAETGSRFYTWPFGDKAINYRQEVNDNQVKYLYLQGNPLIWLAGLAGLVYSIYLIIRVWFFKKPVANRRLFFIICSLLGLYLTYMVAVAFIERVLYLYHYLLPLIFSLLLFFTAYVYRFEAAIKRKDRCLIAGTVVFVGSVVAVYWFFSPLTYYQPLSPSAFHLRQWLPFWHLMPANLPS